MLPLKANQQLSDILMTSVTYQSDTQPLKRVLLKHARDAFGSQSKLDEQAIALNYLGIPNYDEAVRQYDAFANLLEQAGVHTEFLPEDEITTLDSLYVRDNAVVSNNGVALCNMGKPARAVETAEQAQFYADDTLSTLPPMPDGATLEGGDVVWLKDDILAVGQGYRTNAAGIAYLREHLTSAKEIITVPQPHFRGPSDVLHIMSMISPISDDLAVIYSPLMCVSFRERLIDEGYRFVEVPEHEYDTLGCNILTIEPGVVIMAEGSPHTQQALEKMGVKVHTFAGSEISVKGCGGPTCLTRPLERTQ